MLTDHRQWRLVYTPLCDWLTESGTLRACPQECLELARRGAQFVHVPAIEIKVYYDLYGSCTFCLCVNATLSPSFSLSIFYSLNLSLWPVNRVCTPSSPVRERVRKRRESGDSTPALSAFLIHSFSQSVSMRNYYILLCLTDIFKPNMV
jgi:hypothetical protein